MKASAANRRAARRGHGSLAEIGDTGHRSIAMAAFWSC
jgi:hypothetical protein